MTQANESLAIPEVFLLERLCRACAQQEAAAPACYACICLTAPFNTKDILIFSCMCVDRTRVAVLESTLKKPYRPTMTVLVFAPLKEATGRRDI